MKTIEFNGVVYICPFIDAVPQMSSEERYGLRANISSTKKIIYPIVISDLNEVIDGHNRLELAVELGLMEVPLEVLCGLAHERKLELAEELNLHRLHLTRKQKEDWIARRLKADPTRTDKAISKQVQVSDKTVAKVRRKLLARSDIPNVETRTDSKGRKQPSRKPDRKKEQKLPRTHSPGSYKRSLPPSPLHEPSLFDDLDGTPGSGVPPVTADALSTPEATHDVQAQGIAISDGEEGVAEAPIPDLKQARKLTNFALKAIERLLEQSQAKRKADDIARIHTSLQEAIAALNVNLHSTTQPHQVQ